MNDKTMSDYLMKCLWKGVAYVDLQQEAADRIEELEAAIRRQAAAAKTLRQSTLSEVQHIKDSERKAYVAIKTLDSERDANAILTEENEALSTRIAELEAERDEALNQLDSAKHSVWVLEKRVEQHRGKMAKAERVVEMLASADVDAVLGQAVDISCEILGELMEDEDDE